ncbi:DUF4386 domain-containing protein [Pseudalkalibacillus sp. Hm43]|uniref:DUF4386 domain-containing protein n=1 Tax=Pseudalkalibacillus sp. Hm43 TaxID=3450742 RepID=UPI003F42A693
MKENKPVKAPLIAGLSLILMAIAAIFSYGYVHSSLVINGDPATTLTNIQKSISLFTFGILGWVVIIILDIIVSWAFYVLLKPVHRAYSLLAAWLRLIYTAILATAVSHLVIARNIIHESSDSLQTQVMTHIQAFESIWSMGLIVFGLHLFVVGYVALKSSQIPKILSYLLVAAGISYTAVHLLHSFYPQLESTTNLLEAILSFPMFVGELGFGIWLLVKGKKLID